MTERNNRVRFMTNNLGAGGTLTVSSSQVSYPSSNLINNLRFLTWRPAGNFTITTVNQTLYINDGSDKSANVPTGNYTYATLATAIATALNSVSSSWTCTYSLTSFKFTIGRSSGTKVLRQTQTTNAIWSAIGYTGTTDAAAAVANEQRNHTSEYIDVDLGVATPITFVSLLGLLGEVFTISSSATVRLYGNTFAGWASPALTVDLTPSTHGLYKFLDDLSNTSYRYWRLEIVDKFNPAGPLGFKFGYFYLGDYLTLTQRNVAKGFTKTFDDSSTVLTSERGAKFFQKGVKTTKFEQLEIAYMNAADRQALEQALYDLGTTTPFFVSFDPTLLVSADLSELTRYVVFDSAPVFTHQFHNVYSVRFAVSEVI